MQFTWHDSPIGALLLAGDGEALCRVSFPDGPRKVAPEPSWVRADHGFDAARAWLDAYFAGARPPLDLPLRPEGTAFQRAVWAALPKIPYGETMSYGALAEALGRPKAFRAVGAANGANPIPILLPCHRVVGANGTLTGFGGGLPTKEFLLAHEGALQPGPRQGELAL